MPITCRSYDPLTDREAAWRLMCCAYAPDFACGVPAPFLDYALSSLWMDTAQLHRFRLWEDGGEPVGLMFYENPVDCLYFSLLPGYDALAEDMLDAAEDAAELVLFPGQRALIAAAEKRGWRAQWTQEDWLLDLSCPLPDRPLPPGYRFVDPLTADPVKLAKCTYLGFGHGDRAPFTGWDQEDPSAVWTPRKAYLNALSVRRAPHATNALNVIIADAQGEYVCYAGMWHVPENDLAYLEPLCTVPEHRGRGLAAAALSHLARRMKSLGAVCMTGGGSDFYRRLGYTRKARWLHCRRA